MATFTLIRLLLIVCTPGCAGVGMMSLGPPDDRFILARDISGFDAADFRDRLAGLPRNAGWAFPYERMRFLVNALGESGWPENMAGASVPSELQVAVAQALYDAARRPGWHHSRDQTPTVAALAADLTRLCGIEKHVWTEVVAPVLDLWEHTPDARTSRGIANGSEIFQPEGDPVAVFTHIARFIRASQGRRDLFTDDYRHLLHGMIASSPLAATNTLYQAYPTEGTEINDFRASLLELRQVLDQRQFTFSQVYRAEGMDAMRSARAAPASDEVVALFERFARDGGRPGAALAFYYYSVQPGTQFHPKIRQALIDSGSEYAHQRLRELASGIRRQYADPEQEMREFDNQPDEVRNRVRQNMEAALREAEAIEQALGKPNATTQPGTGN
jgi:hypothetical protein